jgi:hypothetical protein
LIELQSQVKFLAMARTGRAIAIIEKSMAAGRGALEAARQAEERTGLAVIPADPVLTYRWNFFIVGRGGKRVLRVHRVYTNLPQR